MTDFTAINAWQERDWVRQDIQAVAESRSLDLAGERDRGKAAGLVESFYAKAAELLDRSLEPRRDNDRLSRTLQAMSHALKQDGQVAFQSEDHAGRFAKDLTQRYGDDLMARLAKGDDRPWRSISQTLATARHRPCHRHCSRAT
ncbi:hypothetical protein ACEUZ9_000804 [Paracoccus litorisediminis]|uniref:hypothetical protein n=1 Tax=Paracoccus litorisediminis TaxID=2006130 RepID=UPI00372E50AA